MWPMSGPLRLAPLHNASAGVAGTSHFHTPSGGPALWDAVEFAVEFLWNLLEGISRHTKFRLNFAAFSAVTSARLLRRATPPGNFANNYAATFATKLRHQLYHVTILSL